MRETLQNINLDSDPFGLNKIDFNVRVPEKSEMFDETEAKLYIDGCDYPESVDDLLLALELQQKFGAENIRNMSMLETMCGPGRLGRELLQLGVRRMGFHDGHNTMIKHASKKAFAVLRIGQSLDTVKSPVDGIHAPDNTFDLVVCHNSTHQLESLDKLGNAMREFLRITAPGGRVIIADYQRPKTPELKLAANMRLKETKLEIVDLLKPTFHASFSKDEFAGILQLMPGIKKWSITDAEPPELSKFTREIQERINADPVKGHLMDYSPISIRVNIQKEII